MNVKIKKNYQYKRVGSSHSYVISMNSANTDINMGITMVMVMVIQKKKNKFI